MEKKLIEAGYDTSLEHNALWSMKGGVEFNLEVYSRSIYVETFGHGHPFVDGEFKNAKAAIKWMDEQEHGYNGDRYTSTLQWKLSKFPPVSGEHVAIVCRIDKKSNWSANTGYYDVEKNSYCLPDGRTVKVKLWAYISMPKGVTNE